MWFEGLPPGGSWASLWSAYVICECQGIRTIEASCPACGASAYDISPKTLRIGGREFTVGTTFMGAEGRYEDYVFLRMLQREWQRPLVEDEKFGEVPEQKRPSARASIAIIFWTYFETRIDRLLRQAMRSLPERISNDLLNRNFSISTRLERLYAILFDTTYWQDLRDLGYPSVAVMLNRVREARNSFTHGQPNSIDDALIVGIASSLKAEHESWIAVYNHRVANKDGAFG